MKFAFKSLNSLLLAGLLTSVGISAMAEGPITAPTTPAEAAGNASGHHMMGQRDPAKMQTRMAKHQAELKAKLKITASQEGAWTSFTAAMQPAAHLMRERPTAEQRAEFDKLNTPMRIDKMQALRTQRMADMASEMDKRGAATKAFYAALSPEQQKTFDAEHQKMGSREGRGAHADRMHS
jgi:hypothetical protein